MSGKITKLKRSERLKYRLSIALGAVIFVAVITVSGMVSWSGFERELSQQRQLFENTASVFSTSIAESLSEKDKRQVQLVLTAIGKFNTYQFASVQLPDNTTYTEMGFDVILTGQTSKLDNQTTYSLLFVDSIWVVREINYAGKRIGQLNLLANISDVRERFFNNILLNLLMSLVSAMAAIFVSASVISKITAPIHDLSNLMTTFSREADYTAKADENQTGEMAVLARSFNTMLSDIKIRDDKLLEYHQTLEDKIEIRTHDLMIAKEEAEMANAVKSEFLATVSHEIRTPMNGMLLMSELLATAQLSPKYQRYANVIMKSGKSLLAIINDILDISKIQSGKLELESLEIETESLVGDVMSLFLQMAEEKKLELACCVDPDVPISFAGDPTRINQVLSNLVNNALKFTKNGGVTIRVNIEGDKIDSVIRFSVVDTGIGIESKNLGKVFDSFSQADQTTTRTHGGTGLGLSICKQLTEAMGGEISVSSTPDHGSEFSFTLPLSTLKTPLLQEITPNHRTLVLLPESKTAEIILETTGRFGGFVEMGEYSASNHIDIAAYDCVIAESAVLATLPRMAKGQYGIAVTDLGDSQLEKLVTNNQAHDFIERPISSISVQKSFTRIVLSKPLGDKIINASDNYEAKLQSYMGQKILVADDSAINREVIIQALSRFHVKPVVVASGIEAIDEFENDKFDLVFMDCSMPEMDGFETTRNLRRVERQRGYEPIPIIALTAHLPDQIAENARNAAMNDVVVKPFTINSIGECFTKWLDQDSGDNLPQHAIVMDEQMDCIPGDSSFDDHLLDNLKEITGEGFESTLKQLHLLYQDSAPDAFTELQEAITSTDFGRIASASHALASMSMNIGAGKLGAICKTIESEANKQNQTELSGIIETAKKEFDQVILMLKEQTIDGVGETSNTNYAAQ